MIRTDKRTQQGCRIKDQCTKSIIFLYPCNEQSKNGLKKTIPIAIASKRIKCLGINLTKKMQNLYPESYRTLFKEIKEDLNNWKNISRS